MYVVSSNFDNPPPLLGHFVKKTERIIALALISGAAIASRLFAA